MEKNNLVSKSNDLINQKYDLSLNEQKIILTLASMVQPNDNNFKIYKMEIKDLADLFEIKDKSIYRKIREIIKNLKNKGFTIERENGNILDINWLSSAEYFTGKGYVELELSSKLRPYLLQLKKIYTSYKLENILSLKSKYSIRIYEILKSNEFKKEIIIDLLEIKDKLCVNEKSYDIYQNFKNRVIIKSQKELKEKTDIEFEFEEIKTGRKVTALKFYIKENEKNKSKNNFEKIEKIKDKKEKDMIQNEEEKDMKIDMFEDKNIKYLYELFEEKISKKNIEKILENAENDIEKVERIYNYSKTQNIENLVGFMIKMVKGDNFIEPIEDKKQISFNDFPQRKYDFDKLEDKLLRHYQDENIQIEDDLKDNDNELEVNDIDQEEEIIYRSEIDTVKMFLEEQLKGIFGEVKYKTWLKYGVDNLDIDDKNIVNFYFTNSFALNMFERDYKDVLLELISSIEPLLKLNTIVKMD
ncbi:replication initiation protein [Clostridium sardiniense]|uniref:replication initiation protein n=1 Tax=Clostridium sardiniense TaxID=29369 RepID=UPI00195E8DF7|nr:replication initiation protein [Clostridium sardiniense]MBM7835627.1 plasmid replication initiation protein [Clostridium sardiniense]